VELGREKSLEYALMNRCAIDKETREAAARDEGLKHILDAWL